MQGCTKRPTCRTMRHRTQTCVIWRPKSTGYAAEISGFLGPVKCPRALVSMFRGYAHLRQLGPAPGGAGASAAVGGVVLCERIALDALAQSQARVLEARADLDLAADQIGQKVLEADAMSAIRRRLASARNSPIAASARIEFKQSWRGVQSRRRDSIQRQSPAEPIVASYSSRTSCSPAAGGASRSRLRARFFCSSSCRRRSKLFSGLLG